METKTHDYEKYGAEYAGLDITGTFYLAFRDIPDLLKKYAKGKNALDYGCGSGRSTRFLGKLGFEVTGVDISLDMLEQAKLKDNSGIYHHIQSGELPFEDSSFDVIFSSFVFLEVPSLISIEKILLEMKRMLNKNGIIVIDTSPEYGYKSNWVSFSYDFPENNRVIKSGDTVKLLIKGTDVILYDYYWTEKDYKLLFKKVGLRVRRKHKPLGQTNDPVEWLDENRVSPMLVYVLDKDPCFTKNVLQDK